MAKPKNKKTMLAEAVTQHAETKAYGESEEAEMEHKAKIESQS